MKCVVLGIDGLEYNFVEKFDLKNLKQAEYGKVRIPPECFIAVESPELHFEPYTPLVWSSFLTGKLPSQHGFKYESTRYKVKWNNRLLNMLRDFSIKLGLNRIRGKGKIFNLIGFTKKRTLAYNVSTLFDFVKSVDITFPVYSGDWSLHFALDPKSFKNFNEFVIASLRKQLKLFDLVKRRTFGALENADWKLLMAYTKMLDIYGELSFNNRSKIYKVYSLVDDFAGEVKTRANGSFVVIISDHGIERMKPTRFGKHSDYGFYSLSEPLGLNNPKITDFYNIILNILQD